IEAITNRAAREYFQKRSESYDQLQKLLGNTKDPIKAVEHLQDENQQLQKQIAQFMKDKARNLKGELKAAIRDINGVQFLSAKIDMDAAGMKDLAFEIGGEVDQLFL